MFRSGDIEDFATNFGHEFYNLDFSNHRFFFLPFFISPLRMAITILPPVVDDADVPQADSDIDAMSMDSESDADTATGGHFQSVKRHHIAGISKLNAGIVTPGEVVTDDPQWMRLAALSLIYYSLAWMLPRHNFALCRGNFLSCSKAHANKVQEAMERIPIRFLRP